MKERALSSFVIINRSRMQDNNERITIDNVEKRTRERLHALDMKQRTRSKKRKKKTEQFEVI